MAKLIITNGDSAAANIRASGIKGRVLEWRDMLHDGPVPASDSLDLVSDARAGFLAETFGLDFAEVRGDFAARDGVLGAHIAYSEVELWFEHDLFDQLQLIQLLDYFARGPERLGLSLVQADIYLGATAPADIEALVPRRAPITALQLEAGRAAWGAFTAADPEGLAALADTEIAALPHLAPALRRLLAELPAPGSGLSLTQARALDSLAAGPMSVGHLFGAVTAKDEARFLGDSAFFLRLDEMGFGPTPLVEGLPFRVRDVPRVALDTDGPEQRTYRDYARAELRLTPAGEAARAGRLDHAEANRIERWLGGTHLQPGRMWRYDPTRAQLLSPS